MSHQEIDRKNRNLSLEVAFAASHYTRERDYWLNKFSGNLERSNFPCKPGVKPGPGARKAAHEFSIQEELFARLMKLCGGTHPRLHMILVGLVAVMLHKYTGNGRVSLGTPIYTPEVEGEFINTVLPLRISVESRATFKELLNETRQTVIEAVRHANYPIEKLLYQLDLPHSQEEFPLFDIVLLLENIQHERYIDHLPYRFLISFFNTGSSIQCTIKYDPSIYEESLINQLSHHFCNLLSNALSRVDSPLSDIDLLSNEEKQYLLFDFNDTETPYPGDRTLHELIVDQAQETPDHTAVNFQNNHLSYQELNKRADRFMLVLKTKGISVGSIVALFMDHHLEVPLVILAILKTGGAYLPLDPEYPPERIQYILKDSNTRHIVTNRSDIALGNPPLTISRPEFSGADLNQNEKSGGSEAKILPIDLAYIMYTSGSTGTPKGVMIEHRGVVNYLSWGKKVYLEGKRYHFPLYSSLAFDLTVTSLFLPLISGNMLVVYKPEKHENVILRVIEEKKTHILKLTPTHLKIILNEDTHFNFTIKKLIVGGEELTASLAREIYEKFNRRVEIYNEYGPTETVVGCMIYKFDPREENIKSVPIGVPVENTHIYLLDRANAPVPRGAVGEIYISGAGTARGYLNNQELTRHRFRFDPFKKGKRMYRSGDLGRLLSNGNMAFMGRSDNQLKIRGYRIEPAEIEYRLMQRKDIEDALVVIREHAAGDTYLTAYLVPVQKSPGQKQSLDMNELRSDLARVLPEYMIPSYFVQLEKIPLTPNGKVDHKALPGPDRTTGESYIAPRDEVETKLVAIWSEVLEIEKEKIGIYTNFFEAGGHSLKATILVSKIHKEFEVRLPMAEIFKAPRIEALAGYLKGRIKDTYVSIKTVEKKEYYPVSSAQKRLYILQQMQADSTSYNIRSILALEQEIDVERLEKTFKKLVSRHDSLRTSFLEIGGEPVQRIHEDEEVDFKIEYYDLRTQVKVENKVDLPAEPVESLHNPQAIEALISSFIRPFDLCRAPLLRVGLIHLPRSFRDHLSQAQNRNLEDQYILVLDMHHITTDGTSHQVLTGEFIVLYSGGTLPPLKLQYKDYSEWQKIEKQKGAIKTQETYWLKQFREKAPLLGLPTDFKRPYRLTTAGKRLPFHLENELIQNIRAVVSETETTLFMLFLAAYYVLLFIYTRQEDIIVGSPVAGRRHDNLENIVGMFVNMMAIRTQPQPHKTFKEFLKEVKNRSLEAFENQEYQFEELVDNINIPRDPGRRPLVETVFTMQNTYNPGKTKNLPQENGLKVERYPYELGNIMFDLTLDAVEVQDSIRMWWTYAVDLFKSSTMEKLKNHYIEILKQAVKNINIRIKEIKVSHDLITAEANPLQNDQGDFGF